jgi:hypothetical protein
MEKASLKENTPEVWEVWRKAEVLGGNLVMHNPAYPDVSGKTVGGTKVAEFGTWQKARAHMEKECTKFLRSFTLKNKRRSQGWVFIARPYSHVWIWGHSYAFRKGVRLFNAGRKWWLRYGLKHHTGHFKSRNEALLWYLRDGR